MAAHAPRRRGVPGLECIDIVRLEHAPKVGGEPRRVRDGRLARGQLCDVACLALRDRMRPADAAPLNVMEEPDGLLR